MIPLISRLCVLTLLSLSLCLSTTRADPDQSVIIRFDANDRALNIPFTLQNNRICVQVRINDSAPLWAALDTGAAVCMLDRRKSEALGLPQEGIHRLDTIGGAIHVPLLKGCTYTVSGFHLDNAPTVAVPLNNVASLPDQPLEAALGSSLFRNAVIEIHYASGRLNLYAPDKYQYHGTGEIIPLSFDAHDVPWISAQCSPTGSATLKGRFKVDTGYSDALIFDARFTSDHRLIETCPTTFPAPLNEIGGLSLRRVGRLKTFQVGTHQIHNPIAFFAQDQRGLLANTRYDGTIGGDFLRRFNVILDYPHKRMILEPNEAHEEPFSYYYFGCGLQLTGTTLKSSSIVGVDANSPASAANLRDGDILLRIDGKPVDNITMPQLQEILIQEGEDHQLLPHILEVERAGRQVTLTYTLAKL